MSYYYVDVRILVESDSIANAKDIVENIVDDASKILILCKIFQLLILNKKVRNNMQILEVYECDGILFSSYVLASEYANHMFKNEGIVLGIVLREIV